FALTSSRQICSPASTCLPAGATPPVSATLRPTLIGLSALARFGVINKEKATNNILPARRQKLMLHMCVLYRVPHKRVLRKRVLHKVATPRRPARAEQQP